MILSIDHIALTCSDSSRACQYLTSMGYKERFAAVNVPNPVIKKNLSQTWCATHDLLFFEKPDSFNIEVIKYDAVYEGKSFLTPVFEHAEYVPGKTIIISAVDLERAYQFWSLFGIKVLTKERDHYVCVFQTPFSKEVFFIIALSQALCADTLMDLAGFNCIAFVSASLVNDHQLFIKKGINVTPIEDIVVNGKKLFIFFAKGSQGENVEVIGHN